MKTMALDPANTTGWAWSNAGADLRYGIWRLQVSSEEHSGNRLVRLRDFILDTHRAYGIDRIACEDASFGSPNPNVQAMHNELRGVIRATAAELGLPDPVLFTPPTIKACTCNNGLADKGQMIAAVNRLYCLKITDDNVADAVAILKMVERGVVPPSSVKKKVSAWRKKAKKAQAKLF